jgi:hypothetical protein
MSSVSRTVLPPLVTETVAFPVLIVAAIEKIRTCPVTVIGEPEVSELAAMIEAL